uniref:Uncharacterized protein n=1 Tax=Anguilla anguilla TaxID=7936 RepID=A0A0E9RWL5_ANGAN
MSLHREQTAFAYQMRRSTWLFAQPTGGSDIGLQSALHHVLLLPLRPPAAGSNVT